MSQSTIFVIVILIVIGVAAIAIMSALSRRARLRALPDESKRRYAEVWHAIEARFIEEPGTAIQEADQNAVDLLRERGARLDGEREAPRDLRLAREVALADEGENGTESMRKAMLHYKAIFMDALGETARDRADSRRREVA